jgi:hypothetical protein
MHGALNPNPSAIRLDGQNFSGYAASSRLIFFSSVLWVVLQCRSSSLISYRRYEACKGSRPPIEGNIRGA